MHFLTIKFVSDEPRLSARTMQNRASSCGVRSRENNLIKTWSGRAITMDRPSRQRSAAQTWNRAHALTHRYRPQSLTV